MTRTKLNQGVHETRGGSESSFSIHQKAKGLGKFTQKLQKLSFIGNSSAIRTQTAGSQFVGLEYAPFSAFDCGVLMAQALTQQYGSLTPTGFQTEKIFMKSAKVEYAYNNNTNDQVRMVLYDIVPKKDIYNTAGDAQDPVTSWANGLTHQGVATSSPQTIVGSTPFGSEMFCHFWTIKKITNVTLAPGQTHYHRTKIVVNKTVSNEDIQQGNLAYLKNCSAAHVSVGYGAPCLTAVGSGVTTEATKVLSVVKIEYEFTYLPNNMSTTKVTNTLAVTTTGNIENMVTGAAGTFAAV